MMENAGTPPQPTLDALLKQLSTRLLHHQHFLCTAESCTGGLIAASCTEKPGSSQWFERGFVTYSNAAKNESLGVPLPLIEQFGAVSEEAAKAMASGALSHSHAHWSIAVTGIAGPTGGTADKPVGLVWFGFAHRQSPQQQNAQLFKVYATSAIFPGNRSEVRQAAVMHALKVLLEHTPQIPPVL